MTKEKNEKNENDDQQTIIKRRERNRRGGCGLYWGIRKALLRGGK